MPDKHKTDPEMKASLDSMTSAAQGESAETLANNFAQTVRSEESSNALTSAEMLAIQNNRKYI